MADAPAAGQQMMSCFGPPQFKSWLYSCAKIMSFLSLTTSANSLFPLSILDTYESHDIPISTQPGPGASTC